MLTLTQKQILVVFALCNTVYIIQAVCFTNKNTLPHLKKLGQQPFYCCDAHNDAPLLGPGS